MASTTKLLLPRKQMDSGRVRQSIRRNIVNWVIILFSTVLIYEFKLSTNYILLFLYTCQRTVFVSKVLMEISMKSKKLIIVGSFRLIIKYRTLINTRIDI